MFTLQKQNRRIPPFLLFLIIGCLGVLPISALAGPWISSGDAQLRHHIEVLADAGVITVPISSWPLMWSGIAQDLERRDLPALNDAQHWSLSYVRFAWRRATHDSTRLTWQGGIRKDPNYLTDFGNDMREQGETKVSADWLGSRFAAKLVTSFVLDPDDEHSARYDGSYVAAVLGNWSMSLGAIDRWWGPGWQNNLILSHNARPVPGIAVQRNFSDAFESPWLSWIGPWQLTTFMGQLENGRTIAEAKLFGMRIGFRPLNGLEFGLSRTAQWGGEGRPQDSSSFGKMLIGKDNRGDDVSINNEPGNQLAGVDWRWTTTPFDQTLSFYGQAIGEDEAGNAPSRFMALLGLETSLISETLHSRIYLEAMDTSTDGFSSSPRYNYAYEHGIYRDGYRFRDRPIGAATDNDSRMLTLKAFHYFPDNRSVQWSLSTLKINRDGSDATLPAGNRLSANALDTQRFEIAYSQLLGELKTSLTLDYLSDKLSVNGDNIGGAGGQLAFEYRF